MEIYLRLVYQKDVGAKELILVASLENK